MATKLEIAKATMQGTRNQKENTCTVDKQHVQQYKTLQSSGSFHLCISGVQSCRISCTQLEQNGPERAMTPSTHLQSVDLTSFNSESARPALNSTFKTKEFRVISSVSAVLQEVQQ